MLTACIMKLLQVLECVSPLSHTEVLPNCWISLSICLEYKNNCNPVSASNYNTSSHLMQCEPKFLVVGIQTSLKQAFLNHNKTYLQGNFPHIYQLEHQV